MGKSLKHPQIQVHGHVSKPDEKFCCTRQLVITPTASALSIPSIANSCDLRHS